MSKEDYKAKGYHSKSEMRRKELMEKDRNIANELMDGVLEIRIDRLTKELNKDIELMKQQTVKIASIASSRARLRILALSFLVIFQCSLSN